MNDRVVFNIELSRRDKEKGLILPTKITKELAYFSGVLVGDGHIRFRKDERNYYIKCAGNPKNEKEYYDNIIKPTVKKLFGIEINPRLSDGGTTYGFHFFSKALLMFLSDIIGLPTGAKSSIIKIPDIFKHDEDLLKSFICGYADTDFCLTLKRRYKQIPYYPVIVGVSKSKRIIEEITEYLKNNGFRVSLDLDRKIIDNRFKRPIKMHRMQIYGHVQLVKWMESIGFRNPRNINKFILWKKRNLNHSRIKIKIIAGDGITGINRAHGQAF